MNEFTRLKNLTPPEGKIDLVLDTDAYNEIDDQFAISFMLKCGDKFNIKGICAAPFHNSRSASAADGMNKSYDEILKLLSLAGRSELANRVYKGSEAYLPDESQPVQSPAADFIAKSADEYSPERPLYIVAIGAITNVASAILKNPKVIENTVILWLGGHAFDIPGAATEFNMVQDIAAARVVFGCGVPLVQLPCYGVVDHLAVTEWELKAWLGGKNLLCDYLVENTVNCAREYADKKPWSRVIWDIAPLFWLINQDGRYMWDRLCAAPIPEYDQKYGFEEANRHFIKYVYYINRDCVFEELFRRLTDENI